MIDTKSNKTGNIGLGYRLLQCNHIIGGYFFRTKDVTVAGPRLRADVYLLNWLSLNAEYQYDKERNSSYYLGAKIRFTTGTINSPFNLRSKMTQIPVRDVDVVSLVREEITEDRVQAVEVTTFNELVDALERNLDEIVITEDLDGNTTVPAPSGGFSYISPQEVSFGTPDSPITSSIHGVSFTSGSSITITAIKAENKKIENYAPPGEELETPKYDVEISDLAFEQLNEQIAVLPVADPNILDRDVKS